jgi:hypothetical protein
MLFPEEEEYLDWFKDIGFSDIKTLFFAPRWISKEKYGIAISGIKPSQGESNYNIPTLKQKNGDEKTNFPRTVVLFSRLFIGSLAGFFFIPIALWGEVWFRLKLSFSKPVGNKSVLKPDPFTRQQKVTLWVILMIILIAVYWIFF